MKNVYNDEVVVQRVQFLNGYVHVPEEEQFIMRSLKRPRIYCLEIQESKFSQLYLMFGDHDRLNQGKRTSGSRIVCVLLSHILWPRFISYLAGENERRIPHPTESARV